jgi:hypothetical protein
LAVFVPLPVDGELSAGGNPGAGGVECLRDLAGRFSPRQLTGDILAPNSTRSDRRRQDENGDPREPETETESNQVHDQPVVGRTCKVNRRQSAIADARN